MPPCTKKQREDFTMTVPKEELRKQALALPASQFFSAPFLAESVNADRQPARRISEAFHKQFVMQNPEILVADVLKAIDKDIRFKILDSIGNPPSASRQTFMRFCERFGVHEFDKPVAEMHDTDYRLTEDAKALLQTLFATKTE